MGDQYCIVITKVLSNGKLGIHGAGEYHFKANVHSRTHNFGEQDVYMIRDLPTINKMHKFGYNFENRTMDVRMEKSDNSAFTITEILSVEKNPSDR